MALLDKAHPLPNQPLVCDWPVPGTLSALSRVPPIMELRALWLKTGLCGLPSGTFLEATPGEPSLHGSSAQSPCRESLFHPAGGERRGQRSQDPEVGLVRWEHLKRMEGKDAEAGDRRRHKRNSRRKENQKPRGHSKCLPGGGGERKKRQVFQQVREEEERPLSLAPFLLSLH